MPDAATEIAIREPTSLVAVHDQCDAIEAWSERCDSVPELRDATNKLAAIDEYLTRTSTEGRGRVAAAMRRLEVRIGSLIGPPTLHHDRRPGATSVASDVGLSKDERHEFRKMAAHPDVVEDVIASSTDQAPASRRKVQEAIQKPRRSPLVDDAKAAAWALRKAVERVERLFADDRMKSNKRQVAPVIEGHLSYTAEVCQDLLNELTKEP